MTQTNHVKSVAVIGAGVGGLVTIKALLAEGVFEKVKAYERQPNDGGIWNYTKETGPSWPVPSVDPEIDIDTRITPVYRDMEANVPYYDMQYNDTPFDNGSIPNRPLYASPLEVAQYLQSYGKNLDDHIEHSTKVLDIRKAQDKWLVKTKSDITGQNKIEEFDAVVLSSGNYNTPYIPNWTGLSEWNAKYPESLTHSKNYRIPEIFKDKTVLVIGAEASGNDIVGAIRFFTKAVYHSVRNPEKLAEFLEANKKLRNERPNEPLANYVTGIDRFEAETKTIYDSNGTEISDVDVVVFATGYLRSYPYLQDINTSEYPVISNGFRVKNTYDHIYYAPDPTLSFIAVPKYIQPFRTAEIQAIHVARVLAGRIDLPNLQQRLEWDAKTGAGVKDEKTFHNMKYPLDMDYCERLVNEINNSKPGPTNLVPTEITQKRRRDRRNGMQIRTAYLKYLKDTGIAVHSPDELVKAGYFEWNEHDE